MGLLQTALKVALTAVTHAARTPTPATGLVGTGSSRYAGRVEGAAGVVDLQVTRIQNQYQNVFRIRGCLRTPAGEWHFDADGHSGYGKLHDESVIYLQLDDSNLAITINPYRPPAPTYRFRRTT